MEFLAYEEKGVGFYIFVFEAGESVPKYDYLQDDWLMARAFCEEDFSVPVDAWKQLHREKVPHLCTHLSLSTDEVWYAKI